MGMPKVDNGDLNQLQASLMPESLNPAGLQVALPSL
jgi:hypothetical protein